MTVYCATTNEGKIREFRLAAGGGLEVEALPGMKDLTPPEESGATFEENAVQKALFYGSRTDGWLFSEDSGLEVEALGGAPGVYSARFSGQGATDAANNAFLLERLAGATDRTARYVCVIALVRGGELEATFRGTVEGVIVERPLGTGGFGYDPLFYYPPFGATFGEVDSARKFSVSHRGHALARLVPFLRQRLLAR